MARDKYNTKTKCIIKEEIINYPNGTTIKKLKEDLDKKNLNVGLTTIYRSLEDLCDLGIVKKYYNEKNIDLYKYVNDCISDNHFYLKCEKCGKITHVDCSCIEDLYLHILKQHHFSIDTKSVILNGLCNDCKSFISF